MTFCCRSGAQPVIYTEALNSEQLMLVISSLTDTMAGNYFCSASYANSEMLEAKVKVETYGMNDALNFMNYSLTIILLIRMNSCDNMERCSRKPKSNSGK